MSTVNDPQKLKVIQEAFQCFGKALEMIVSGRQRCQPTEDSTNRPPVINYYVII